MRVPSSNDLTPRFSTEQVQCWFCLRNIHFINVPVHKIHFLQGTAGSTSIRDTQCSTGIPHLTEDWIFIPTSSQSHFNYVRVDGPLSRQIFCDRWTHQKFYTGLFKNLRYQYVVAPMDREILKVLFYAARCAVVMHFSAWSAVY